MKISGIILLNIMVVSFACLAGSDNNNSVYFCKSCRSAYQSSDKNKVNYIYKGELFKSCKHTWNICKSNAYPEKIVNGQIILVKKGDQYGAFQFTEQKTIPEYALFNWWYIDDGSYVIDVKNKKLLSGKGKTTSENGIAHYVEFGPFKVLWSVAGDSKGWLYYPLSLSSIGTRKIIDSEYMGFWVTDVFVPYGINVVDSKWKYQISHCF